MTQSKDAQFNSTRWTCVLRTRGEGEEARRALQELCADYWFPLYAFAYRRGFNRHDAEDLVQGFFQTALHRRLFQSADPDQGRLRNLLLKSFRRHVQDAMAYQRAAKRRPAKGWTPFDFSKVANLRLESLSYSSTPEASFDQAWALRVLDFALARLETRYASEGKRDLMDALRSRLVDGEEHEPLASVAAKLGMNEGAVRVALHRMRARFRECLRDVVRDTVDTDEEVDDELENLRKILGSSP